MTLRSRTFVRFGLLFLVARLVADIATPLSPGAFRLGPGASVQAARPPQHAMALVVPAAPSRGPEAPERHVAPPRQRPRPVASIRTVVPRVLPTSESIGSPPATDDD
jgi:hypothetical protein